MKPRKTPARTAARKKSGGGTLIGLFIGLVIGVLGAAAVVWYINKMPMPFTTNGHQPPSPAKGEAARGKGEAATDKGEKSADKGTGESGKSGGPAALPGKPGDPVPKGGDKPRFDFYKILPGNADAIPDPRPADKPEKSEKPDKSDKDSKDKAEKTDKGEKADKADKPALKEPLYLQAGSFQNAGDADNQKAKLALMGAEATIQQVMVQDKVWYRVRLGPFNKIDDVNRVRADLARQGIDAAVVKKD